MSDAPVAPEATTSSVDLQPAAVSAGVALLSAAVVISTVYSRLSGQLDWSNYLVGLLATAGLLGIAALAATGVVGTDLVAWPGAFGAVGAGLMVAVALDDFGDASTVYAATATVVAIAVLGYAASRRAAFVAPAVAALFVGGVQLYSDLFDYADDSGQVHAIWVALAFTLFSVAVTAACWPLSGRVIGGVLAGAFTVAGFAAVMQELAIYGMFARSFTEDDYADYYPARDTSVVTDTWVILGLALVLILFWVACAAVTGHPGFRLLVVAMAVAVTPAATFALTVAHPTWWGVVLAGVGGALLVAVGVDRARLGGADVRT